MSQLEPRTVQPDIVVLFEEARILFPERSGALDEIEQKHPLPKVVAGDETAAAAAAADAAADARRRALRALLHNMPENHAPAALCMSGGGIRSATFGLGVLQGLARRRLLGSFHYLSTVSGGGYAGTWLSTWVRNEALSQRLGGDATRPPDAAAFAAARERVFQALGSVGQGQPQEPAPLRRLRAFSSYLSPMRGVSADALTLLAIYARNLLLNWMVLIPCLLAALLLPRWYVAVLDPQPPVATGLALGVAAVAWLLVAWTIAYMASDLPADPRSLKPEGRRLTHQAPRQARGIFVPLVLPLLCAALLLTWLVGWHTDTAQPLLANDSPVREHVGTLTAAALVGGLTHALASVFGGIVLRRVRGGESGHRPATATAALAVTVVGALTGVGLHYLVRGLWALPRGADGDDLRALALWGVPSMMALFWIGVTLYAGWRRPEGHEDEREWWARAAARWMSPAVVWLLSFGLVLYLPGALLAWGGLQGASSAAVGVGTGALGALVALAGYASKQGPAWRQQVEGVAQAVGLRLLDLAAIVFIVLLLVGLSFGLSVAMPLNSEQRAQLDASLKANVDQPAADKAMCTALKAAGAAPLFAVGTACNPAPCAGTSCAPWSERASHRYERSLTDANAWPLLLGIFVLGALALLASWRIGVNAFSLHSLYGNRLVRAYLAASRPPEARRPHWFTGFDPQDNLAMSELWPPRTTEGTQAPRLLQVIGIALNLVAPSGRRLEWQDRKAAPFTVSPLYSGSEVTGYVDSSLYVASAHHQGISAGAAMTVSGAAASPNMGYHSSAPLAFVMGLFNVRLGLWMPNPRWPALKGGTDTWPWKRDEPTAALAALWTEAAGLTSDDSRFVNLSDGGHFDNMGLYEMVRRRCRRIVLVDATADPGYRFDDLLSTLRKIRIDMGIVIEFPAGLPGPVDLQRSGRAVAVGVMHYGDADAGAPPGTLVLIKPTLLADPPDGPRLPADVRRYAEQSAKRDTRFPQQPTSDQFFDEAQFESYRMLGLHTVLASFADGDLSPGGGPPPEPGTPPAGAALPAAAAVASSAGPAAAGGLLDGLKSGVGVLATGAVVTAATVTGVVTLSNPRVELADPRVTIANPRVELVPTPAASAASGVVSAIDTRPFEQSLRLMADAAASSASATGAMATQAAAAATAASGLAQRSGAAASAVDSFARRLAAPLPRASEQTLTVRLDLNDSRALLSASASASAAAAAAVQAERRLETLEKYLRDIRNSAAQTPPHTSTRGAGEGVQR